MFMGSDVFRFREDSPRGEASNKAGCDAGICESLHQIAASLGHAIDAKDRSTSSHSRQVADLARCLALRAGLTPYQAEMIHIAGHLHDIGKIGIPDEILSKRAALTDAEWAMIRLHPVTGANIVAPVRMMNGPTGISKMILHHHERWDGGGYPHGLRGDSIPLGARILCLADSFSAMMQSRSYRDRLTLGGSVEEVRRNKGSQFDPELCGLMVEMLLEAGVSDEYCSVDLLVIRIMCSWEVRETITEIESAPRPHHM
jgi:HD-GYP domain-containing protein (c-di-GMP phosphodiesterase class II)